MEKSTEACRHYKFSLAYLRHTWASWHVQNGTSLQELQQLGGLASFEMVLRYAHHSSDHLRDAAARINATITPQSLKQSFQNEVGVSASD